MKLLKFIWQNCRGMMLLTSIAAAISGACNAGLIAMVNHALTSTSPTTKFIIGVFIAVGIGKLASNFVAQALLASFSQGVIADLRRSLIRKVLTVPLRSLEELGIPRVLVARSVEKNGDFYAGPFLPAKLGRRTMGLAHRLFGIRSCNEVITGTRGRPCPGGFIIGPLKRPSITFRRRPL